MRQAALARAREAHGQSFPDRGLLLRKHKPTVNHNAFDRGYHYLWQKVSHMSQMSHSEAVSL